MNKVVFICALLAIPVCGMALRTEPWFGEAWQFELDSSYTYSRFRRVQNPVRQLKHPFNSHVVAFDLSVAPSMGGAPDVRWSHDLELELAATTQQSFGFRSAAAQIRYLWMDDVLGDPVSWTTGFVMRGVPTASLRDISSPYHSFANFELNSALGKEWDQGDKWLTRTYGLVGAGMANRGYPWVRCLIVGEVNYQDRFQGELFAVGYLGTGGRRKINIDHFNGYAFIKHRSIDIGVKLRYLFDIWGSISLDYAYRVYARSYPEHVNAVTLCYRLPFSLFSKEFKQCR